MKSWLGWALLLVLPLQSTHAAPVPAPGGRVMVWTEQEGPYGRGERARVYLSTDRAGYVTVLRVDTDGRLRILFPREPWDDNYVRGARTLEVLGARGAPGFTVDDPPGVGYLFAIASSEPFDYDQIARGDHWDYRTVDGGRIEGDPYVVLTDLAARLSPGADFDYDIVPYHVERRYDYPRFVCYDCHGYSSYEAWDPYRSACSRFRLLIYEDPAYYPYRYNRGRNVVVTRPRRPAPRYVFRDWESGSEYITHLRGSAARVEPGVPRGAVRPEVSPGARRVAPSVEPGRRRLRAIPPETDRERREARRSRKPEPEADRSGAAAPSRARGGEGRRAAPPARDTSPRSTGEPELRRRKP